jgi:hypothetical protein
VKEENANLKQEIKRELREEVLAEYLKLNQRFERILNLPKI